MANSSCFDLKPPKRSAMRLVFESVSSLKWSLTQRPNYKYNNVATSSLRIPKVKRTSHHSSLLRASFTGPSNELLTQGTRGQCKSPRTKLPQSTQSSMYGSMRSIICEVCKLPRRSSYGFDICKRCTRLVKRVRCSACPSLFCQLAPERLLCFQCTNLLTGERIVCESCGVSDFSLKVDPRQCRRCHMNSMSRKCKAILPKNVICVDCGLTKNTYRKNEMICRSCYVKRRYGDQKCSTDGCTRPVQYKKLLLCEWHNRLR